MELFEHYAEYDNSHLYEKPYNINSFTVRCFNFNIQEKEKSYYNRFGKLINKTDFKRFIIKNKSCARIRIGFTYWDDHKLTEEEYREMIRKYLISEVERTLR